MTGAPAPGIDLRALDAWLAGRVAGLAPLAGIRQFQGGQSNPTFLLTDAAGRRYVLRKKPDGVLLPSAHAIDREYRVMQALAGTAVPVPKVLCYCDEPGVIGAPFYLMDFVEGRIFWDPALPELQAPQRAAMYDEMNRVIAALHTVDPAAVGLGDYGRPEGFFQRQVERWTKQYRASATGEIEAMERLIEWLPQHLPATSLSGVFHGDFRLDNLIFHPTEPRVLAVLDWELSTLGDPRGDFAYHLLPWRLTSAEFRGMAERDLASLGIPSEADYVRRYAERTGREVDPADHEFGVIYSMFRLAAILQGILKRSLDGTAADPKAHETGLKARGVAEAAWRQVQAHWPGA
ncbi:phosphotransferase family protein [Ramlibacter sp. MAHUQ-53]|uniref:phosphotransferase family protein n=1 Tax=unclassified Ramlibacter TaxID=2617605 RepID=UPI003640992F